MFSSRGRVVEIRNLESTPLLLALQQNYSVFNATRSKLKVGVQVFLSSIEKV